MPPGTPAGRDDDAPVEIHSLARRPELQERCWDLTKLWPPFMLHDPVGDLYFARLEDHAAHAFVALHEDRIVARAFSVPFAMGEELGRTELPVAGWDGVISWAWLDHLAGRAPTHVSALEITVVPDLRGTGLAQRLLAAMKDAARAIGAGGLVAPVRPSRKHFEPHTPMAEYAARTGDDGLPWDSWLRLHVRAGGRIEAVCPRSMTVAGSLAEWRSWSGLPLRESGRVEVAGALVPVHVDVDQDHAVYVEPNVWVVHDLRPPGGAARRQRRRPLRRSTRSSRSGVARRRRPVACGRRSRPEPPAGDDPAGEVEDQVAGGVVVAAASVGRGVQAQELGDAQQLRRPRDLGVQDGERLVAPDQAGRGDLDVAPLEAQPGVPGGQHVSYPVRL